MGLLAKLITGNIAAKAVNKAIARHEARQAARAGAGQYIPAGESAASVVPTRGMSVVDRAGAIYRNNPKLVGSIGIAAGLAALAMLRRKP